MDTLPPEVDVDSDRDESRSIDETIDARSFHVFEREGDRLLFDRATASTLELSEDAFAVFRRLRNGMQLRDAIADAFAGATPEDQQDVAEAILALKARGFLQYVPVDKEEQDRQLELYWEHRPRRVQLLMAQGCNLGCRYCYAWRNGSNQKGTLMSWEVAKASVDHLVRNSGHRTELQVTFFGGEPLLNLPMIRRVVEYCRGLEKGGEKKFSFELITNGTLLTAEVTEWIVSERFLLFVSLDGTEEMHNYNRPALDGTNQYANIVNNALYARRRYEEENLSPVKVRANLTKKHPNGQLAGEYLASLGFKVIGVAAIEPLPHGDPSPAALTEEQMDRLYQEGCEVITGAMEKLAAGEKLSPFEGSQLGKATGALRPLRTKGVNCGVARNTQVVDNKGRIFPCHRYEGMEAYILGDVFSGLDRELTMTYYRKVNRNAMARCHSCWIRDYCAGGCAWLLSAKDGTLADPTEQECNRRRDSLEYTIWLRQKMRKRFPERFNHQGEIKLETWEWGAEAESLNDAPEEAVAMPGGTPESCGSGCSECGPSGCSSN